MPHIKIAFIASTFVVGGSERVFEEIISGLPADRYTCRLYTLKSPGAIGESLFARGHEGAHNLQKCRFDPLVLPRIVRHFKKYSPDILICLDHHNAVFWGMTASLFAGVPARIIASHTTGRFGGKSNFKPADRLLLPHVDEIIALSGSHARYLADRERIDPARITIIPNGIDIERFGLPDPDRIGAVRSELKEILGRRNVLMAAALRPEKAHEAFLDAAAAVRSDYGDVKFIAVGGGPRRKYLEDLRDRRGLRDNVVFLGARNDIPELMSICDMLVLPSHDAVETLPLVLLEAMAAGIPVIASAVGSVPEIITHGRNGLLIPPADGKALADAILKIIPDLQSEKPIGDMIRHARELVESRYTSKHMLEGYMDLFEKLIRG